MYIRFAFNQLLRPICLLGAVSSGWKRMNCVVAFSCLDIYGAGKMGDKH